MRVACIGASIAGLGTALELLKLNPDTEVTLYDKKPHVGANILCGGAISSFMLRELKMEVPSHVIASKITNVRIYAPNGEFWQLDSEGEPYGYILWRDIFERHLAAQVFELGGEIKMSSSERDLWELAAASEYDYIVGADGLTGATRSLIGSPRLDDVHIGVQMTGYLNQPRNRIDLYLGRQVAPRGYAWVFPLGKKMVRIGLGIPLSEKNNPRKLLSKFMDYIEACGISPVRGKLIPTTKPPKKLVFGDLVLVGDAAHLCDPLTGGGIANALLSGKYAAKAITEGSLEKYDSYCRGLKRRNLIRYRLKRILYDLSDDDFNEMIAVMKDFKPRLTRISLAIMHTLLILGLKKPKLFTKHKVLRKLWGLELKL